MAKQYGQFPVLTSRHASHALSRSPTRSWAQKRAYAAGMSWLWIGVLNWAFLLASVGAIGVGIWLTRGRVRLLLAVSLGLFLLQMLLGRLSMDLSSETAMVAFSAVQGLLALGTTGTFVAAAVTGFRQAKASQRRVAELTEETPEAWVQPEGSPDPRLLAD